MARAFFELYRTQHGEFPPECRDSGYEQRIRAAYPIHPEVFDRLYSDWSTLARFQRTRGVLRLMAAVIHSLWERGDRNPLIMPANLPIDDPRVRDELTRYLPDQWKPIIEKDVDGPNALPLSIDAEIPNLGKYAATRRVARTIYLGSAPTTDAANHGIEDRRIKLGCAMPGEQPPVFGDALRRLSSSATFLYQDGPRYWYSTQPTVTKIAEDLAEQYKRNPDAVAEEIEARVRGDLKRSPGDFNRIHPMPPSSIDVPDDMDARLVVLAIDHAFSKDPANKALAAAEAILQQRGTAPRICQNTLVFLAVDQTRLQDLDEAVRRYLAWRNILQDNEQQDTLAPQQRRLAETQRDAAASVVEARIPEAYQWLLVPEQKKPGEPITWQTFRLAGQDGLAPRAFKKLKGEELLISSLAGTRLRMELDKIPLWRGDHVSVRQLAEDFSRYLYLPRLRDPQVLSGAIQDGLGLLLWEQESFAYADSYDEANGRYVGLRGGKRVDVFGDLDAGLVVRSDIARKQLDAEVPASGVPSTPSGPQRSSGPTGNDPVSSGTPSVRPSGPRRYHGTVELDPTRVGRDAGRIADEVISHLVGLVGANVTVTLEIQAELPQGATDGLVRTVTENGRTLKFKTQGFERE